MSYMLVGCKAFKPSFYTNDGDPRDLIWPYQRDFYCISVVSSLTAGSELLLEINTIRRTKGFNDNIGCLLRILGD